MNCKWMDEGPSDSQKCGERFGMMNYTRTQVLIEAKRRSHDRRVISTVPSK